MPNLVDKYKLIIFDLDGTLVHTIAEYRYFVVPKVLEKLGVIGKNDNLELIDKFWFDGNRDETIASGFKCDPKDFWKVFRKLDRPEERRSYTRAYEDVKPALVRLQRMGKILAITTGAPKWVAKMEIDFLPKDLFARIVSITSTRYKNKPHPESLFACLKYFKCKNDEVVYIGNSNDDSIYANAAAVDFIYLERREHNFVGPSKAKIHSLLELLD